MEEKSTRMGDSRCWKTSTASRVIRRSSSTIVRLPCEAEKTSDGRARNKKIWQCDGADQRSDFSCGGPCLPRTTERSARECGDECSELPRRAAPQSHGRKSVVRGLPLGEGLGAGLERDLERGEERRAGDGLHGRLGPAPRYGPFSKFCVALIREKWSVSERIAAARGRSCARGLSPLLILNGLTMRSNIFVGALRMMPASSPSRLRPRSWTPRLWTAGKRQ